MHLFVILFAIISTATGYNILLICPFPAPSHWLWVEHFARELVNRGHHVTAVTNHKTKEPHPNYTEIIIDPPFDIPTHFPKDEIFDLKFNSYFHNLLMWWEVGYLTSDHALGDPSVRELIASKNLKFDLLILEQFFHESFLMFSQKFNIPIVTIGTMGYADNMDNAMGFLTPWAIVPHLVLPYNDNMTFYERAHNAILSLYDFVMRKYYYMPRQQELAEKHFKSIKGEIGTLQSVEKLEKSISMMLINSHISVDVPRPNMPNLVSVGGIHIKPVKPLPKIIKDFLDSAENGAIYFSLGSYIKSTDMPNDKLQIILETFAKLPQKVLWKYEDDSLTSIPKNVMIQKWMPQNDILAHPNIVLFITHGGIFGTQESIYHAVPMLFLPLYGDQHRNSLRSVTSGLGLIVSFKDLTVDDFLENIKAVTENEKYKNTAKEISSIFRDNLVNPLDESMYWIEYVIRHKGAKHLKSAGIHIDWYQYLFLDIIAVLLLIFVISAFVFYQLLRVLLNRKSHKTKKYD